MQVNNALWILVIGMCAVISILIFIVVFVVHAKVSVMRQCSDCLKRITQIEEQISDVNKVNTNLKDVIQENREILKKVQKLF